MIGAGLFDPPDLQQGAAVGAPLHPDVAELVRARLAYDDALTECELLSIEADRLFAASLAAASPADADALLTRWRAVKLDLGTNAERRATAMARCRAAQARTEILASRAAEWWAVPACRC